MRISWGLRIASGILNVISFAYGFASAFCSWVQVEDLRVSLDGIGFHVDDSVMAYVSFQDFDELYCEEKVGLCRYMAGLHIASIGMKVCLWLALELMLASVIWNVFRLLGQGKSTLEVIHFLGWPLIVLGILLYIPISSLTSVDGIQLKKGAFLFLTATIISLVALIISACIKRFDEVEDKMLLIEPLHHTESFVPEVLTDRKPLATTFVNDEEIDELHAIISKQKKKIRKLKSRLTHSPQESIMEVYRPVTTSNFTELGLAEESDWYIEECNRLSKELAETKAELNALQASNK